MMKTKTDNYDVGIYCRLSRDDNNGSSESMSISNQREMLKSYVKDKGWSINDIYIDDGYSGVTFDRPEFKRMIADIEAGKINLVITKDLSRLGRNYIQTGQYTDFFFPRYGVRYIAVNDNHDSEDIDNDITPFKNILNEMYAKDISKKVKSARKTSAKQGKFMGSVTPFGYIKNPLNKYQLIPDEETAPIMQRIFKLFADGNAARHIADILNRESVSSPAIYYYNKLGKQHPNPKVSNTWTSATIMQLLRNEVYLGNMVQGKRAVTSFKTKERHFTDPSEWIIVEGTHDPLVDMETWEAVQKRTVVVKHQMNRVCHTGEISLFAGLLKCSDCGSALVFNTKNQHGKKYMGYKCSRYVQHGKYICSIHSVSLELLEETILQDIQHNAKLAVSDNDRLIKRLMCLEKDGQEEKRLILERKMREAQNRIKTVDGLSKKLFEDRYAGNVPDNIFKNLMNDYENEQNELEANIDGWKLELAKITSAKDNISQWVENISKYTEIPNITRPVLLELIDSITVSEKQVVNGAPQQEIIINYKFIGNLK
ncbi:MAG: recombinase family protein [Oscillospiraceae bacterium]|nr:recombinase family protein [Oscillospiraceae bacterium]